MLKRQQNEIYIFKGGYQVLYISAQGIPWMNSWQDGR